MPIYDMICEECGHKDTFYFLSLVNVEKYSENCPSCSIPMKRDYSGSSFYGKVEGGTGGGAGMGLKERKNN